MLQRLFNNSVYRFGLTKFSQDVTNSVLPTAPQLNKPQVIDTQTRQQYRHENKIRFKRNPNNLNNDWTRDFHNRVYTEK